MPTELPHADTPPEMLFLQPSKLRWMLTLVVSALIVALDLFLIARQGTAIVWILVVVFSMSGLLALSQLIPGGGGLMLDRDGFTMKVAFFTRRRLWSEISPVVSSNAGLFQLVGYHIAGEPTSKPREVLPETYGLGAHQLGGIMNVWRARALGVAPQEPAHPVATDDTL